MITSDATLNTNWCEVDLPQLSRNAAYFKSLVGESKILAIPVKAHGYGHDMVLAGKAFLAGGRIGCVCIRFKKFSNFAKLGLQREFILLGLFQFLV